MCGEAAGYVVDMGMAESLKGRKLEQHRSEADERQNCKWLTNLINE